MSADDPTIEELRLLHALSNVCDQYMPGSWEYVECQGFTAGVCGVQLLSEYGLVKYDPHFGGSWTTKAIVVREQHEITSENYEKIKTAYLADEGKLLSSITRVRSPRSGPVSFSRTSIDRIRQVGQTKSARKWLTLHKQVAFLVVALTMLVLALSRRG